MICFVQMFYRQEPCHTGSRGNTQAGQEARVRAQFRPHPLLGFRRKGKTGQGKQFKTG